jgi:hypothetical protein
VNRPRTAADGASQQLESRRRARSTSSRLLSPDSPTRLHHPTAQACAAGAPARRQQHLSREWRLRGGRSGPVRRHDLPGKDGHVQFPDARIVYEDRDGREHTRDIEVETLNYRGAHASAKASSGFSRHSAAGMRVVGSRGAGGGGSRRGSGGFAFTASTGKRSGRDLDTRLAEELLR